VIGKPSRVLDDVLPSLGTLLNVIVYSPQAQVLTLRRQPELIALESEGEHQGTCDIGRSTGAGGLHLPISAVTS
jgi:hypothetical protein